MAPAVVDNNEEIFTFFPHRLEIKSEMFMTIFRENLITARDRDMDVIKICGHARNSVCDEHKEQGIPYQSARSFLNTSRSNSHPQSTQNSQICQISSNLMSSSNRTTTADDLNSEKVTNYHRKRRQQQRLIKSTKFRHTLEAYFTLRKDVPLNQQRRYFLDTILLPISVLYCILDHHHHHRRLATISNMT